VNKLKFNLKKREFTLLGLSLSLLALRFPPSSVPLSFLCPRPHYNQLQHRTIADRIFISSPSTIASLHQLIGANRPHRLVSTLRQLPLSWTSNFKFLKRSNHRLKRSALSLFHRLPSTPNILCGQVSSFGIVNGHPRGKWWWPDYFSIEISGMGCHY
jgi:hypothetical protein